MKKKKASLIELKKQLRKKTDYELVEEIADLYKKFPLVKEYYQASYFGEDKDVLKKYKQIIEDEFIPSEFRMLPKMRISVAKKAISDYKKVSCSNAGVADLMLTYVETCISFSVQFGYDEDPLYSSALSVFSNALKFIRKHDINTEFADRITMILQNSRRDYCWFEDELKSIYHEIY